MKAVTQIVLPLLIVVGLVAGVTFVKQYSATTPPVIGPETGTAASAEGAHLFFPVTTVEWAPSYAAEVEMNMPGHHDFWFANQKPFPVKLGVFQKNCKCAKIEIAMLTKEEAPRYKRARLAVAAGLALQGAAGPLAVLSRAEVAQQGTPGEGSLNLRWSPMEKDDTRGHFVVVPPESEGILRLSWEGKKPGHERLVAEFWTQPEADRAALYGYQRLEVPLVVVPPMRNLPPEANLGDIYPGGSGEARLFCWSSTRADLPLDVTVMGRDDKPDRNFSCSWEPLSQAECEALAKEQTSRVLCAYRVTVRVQERLSDGTQLDLGPFRRKLSLVSTPGFEAGEPLVIGVVRGDVTVGTEADRDRISLGSFRAEVGRSRSIDITAENPKVELLPTVEVEPEILKAELKPDPDAKAKGLKRWTLTVGVPPNRGNGILPPTSAAYVTIQSDPPRRIRIPVTGNAYQR